MEFLKLKLANFAGFEGLELDLGDGGPGLYVIYGLNEAGKSTLRRALVKFLYGFHTRQDPDVRGRKRQQTRIEARLRVAGKLYRVCRSAHANRLTGDEDDLEELLESGLRGLSRELFENIFCLGHQELREGGQRILSVRDDQGGLFFLASGVRSIDAIRRTVHEEAESLFTERSRGRELDRLLRQVKENQIDLRKLQVRGDEWKRVEEELHATREELERCRKSLAEVRRRKEALEILVQRKRLQKRIAERESELAELGGAENLDETLFDRFQETQDLVKKTENEVREIDGQLRDHRRQLERIRKRLQDDDELARFGALAQEAVTRIRDRLHTLQDSEKARRDAIARLRQPLRSLCQRVKRVTGQAMDSLPKALDRARAIERGLPKTTLEHLRREWDRVDGQYDEAQQKRDEIASELRQIEGELQRLADVPSSETVEEAELLRAEAQALSQALCRTKDPLVGLEERINRAKCQLGIDGLSDDRILRAELPGESDLRRVCEQHSNLRETLREAEKRIRELEEQVRELETEQEADEAEGFPGLEAELRRAKQRREELWGQLRRWIIEDPDELAALDRAPREELANNYSAATAEVDRLYDELLRHHQKIERFRQRQRDLHVRRRKLDQERASYNQLKAQLDACEREFAELWRDLYVRQDPARAGDWLERVRELRSDLEHRGRLQERAKEQESELRRVLRELFAKLGRPWDAECDPAVVLSRVPEVLSSVKGDVERRNALVRDRDNRRRDLESYEQRLRTLHDKRRQIAETVGRVTEKTPEEGSVAATLEELAELVGELSRIEGDIQLVRDYRRPYKELQAVVAETCGVRLCGRSLTEYAERLDRCYDEAVRLLQEQGVEEEQVRRYGQQLKEAKARHDAAQRERDGVLKQLGCQSPAEVLALRDRVTKAKNLLREIRRDQSQLQSLPKVDAGNFPELEGDDGVDTIEALKAKLDEEIQRLEAERDELVRAEQECKRKQKELQARDGQALQAARKREELLADLQAKARRYLVLKATEWVLDRAVQIHKDRAGPVLEKRAGELFATLTGGRYRGFEVDPKQGGEIRILRCDGDELETDELSDGTADQLFLALRLAVVEQFLMAEGPIPVVLDDVLVHFDDDRARYGLETLATIGQKTQVLLFTHHRRIVELAQDVDGAVVIRTLRLGNQAE